MTSQKVVGRRPAQLDDDEPLKMMMKWELDGFQPISRIPLFSFKWPLNLNWEKG
jgi:hypothetical protein